MVFQVQIVAPSRVYHTCYFLTSFDLLWNENVPGLYVQLLVNHYNQTFDYYHGDPKIFFLFSQVCFVIF